MSDHQTIATYDQIAREFADRVWNIDLDAARTAFAEAVAGRREPEWFRILDAGCGPGRDSQWFHRRGFSVVGVDLSTGMLAEARRRVPEVEFVQADLRRLEFSPGHFDGIWCSASLLHLPRGDVPGVLSSFFRLLGHGWLHVRVKAGEGEEYTDRPLGRGLVRRFTYFTSHELELLLERAGFRVHTLHQDPPTDAQPHPWLTVLAQTKLRSPLVGASALLFDDAGRVLLSERGDGRGWNLPGGIVDAGEAPDEAVVREVREEAGLEIAVEQFIGTYTAPPSVSRGGHSLILHSFLCRIVGSTPSASKEARRHGWFAPDALPSPMFSSRHVDLVEDAVGVRTGRLRPPVCRRHGERDQ